MNNLQRLYAEFGQSPWLDNLKRGYITSGELVAKVERGIRGITSNPTIFQKAIQGQADYNDQFGSLIADKTSVNDAYWELVIDDIVAALGIMRPVYDESKGGDGFVSLEVSPTLARDTDGTIAAARYISQRISLPNLLVKIPATAEGIPAIRQMTSEGVSVNVTLIFSLDRYQEVMEAYQSGLEALVEGGGDPSTVHSVASFFVSRVDTEVDRRLDAIATPEALELRGKAAVAQAKCAYRLFTERFAGDRWDTLAAKGAHLQRPLWASTSTKNPAYPDTLYVDQLIGPDSVNTMPENTIESFLDHRAPARTIDQGVDDAAAVLDNLEAIGVSMAEVGHVLEEEGVASFSKSFDELLTVLSAKADELAAG
jgi:transaldolase